MLVLLKLHAEQVFGSTMEWSDHATGTFNTSVCRYMLVLLELHAEQVPEERSITLHQSVSGWAFHVQTAKATCCTRLSVLCCAAYMRFSCAELLQTWYVGSQGAPNAGQET